MKSLRPDRAELVGIYLRVSREDDHNLGATSESIINQKSYLVSYARERQWQIIDFYVDDGWSGTNFNRPAFKRMIEDAKSKRINTILTKDLSRLGRDYVQTGYYIETFFPENRIRFVAANDGVDTWEDMGGNDLTPFRAVINDMYAKDISKKVKVVLENKKNRGEYVSAFAPYGYFKENGFQNGLRIDPNAAPVVRQIYQLYVEGFGYLKIAEMLNAKGIQSPCTYKANNSNYKNPKMKKGQWTHATIQKILSDPTYAGHTVQQKTIKVSYKSDRQINIPRDQWKVIKNTHLPIIEESVFEAVQQAMKTKQGHIRPTQPHLLAGMLFCGDCGARMTFQTSNKICYCICSGYRRHTRQKCTGHLIREDAIEDKVLSSLIKMDPILDSDQSKKLFVLKMVERIVIYERGDLLEVHIQYAFKRPFVDATQPPFS